MLILCVFNLYNIQRFNDHADVRSQSGIEIQSLLVGIQLPFLQIRLATDEPSGKVKRSIQDIVHVLKEF